MRNPSFIHERALASQGHVVIGVDEVGCGCLAGPVIAAAVHLPLNSRIGIINDSKLLSAAKREYIFMRLLEMGVTFTIGMATVDEIDALNIRQASLLSMQRAINAYKGATFALVDAWRVPGIKIDQCGIIHGDKLVKSIAAASILAKVVRDRLMKEYDMEFPGYFFARHKGYGTVIHKNSLQKLGSCSIHRRSFL